MDSIEWQEMYLLAKAYYEIYESVDIPVKFRTEKIKRLNKWLEDQKESYKQGILSKEQIEALENLQINWEGKIGNSHENKWNRIYLLAKKYYEDYGNLDVPVNYVTEQEGIKLGIWISTQRTNYKKHKLSKERIDALESIGMKWSLVHNKCLKQKQWNKMYERVLQYYQKYNNIDIPINYEEEGIKLGRWLAKQQGNYINHKLSKDRIEKLESIGVKWERNSILNDKQWNRMYFLAKEYSIEHNDLNIPTDYKTKEGIKLGRWIVNQRQAYQNNKLSKERIESLESIGMIWRVRNKTTKDNIKNICTKYNIDYDANKDILEHVSINELLAKIHYLSVNNISIVFDGKLNEIFRMSNINLKIAYGCSLEEMIQEYLDVEAKLKQQTVLKKVL